jgi:hypothetical protein
MSFDINVPKITAQSDAGKIEQIRSYLFQLADQLKWALNSIEKGGTASLQTAGTATGTANSVAEADKQAQATFNSIKALIIKSADIVEAYSEGINKKFSGEYVAKSDFGTYTEQTEQSITTNSTNIEVMYSSIQEIITDIESLEHSLIEVDAHIRSGILYYDDDEVPIYGLEIGQKNTIDGEEVFNKYARFTSDRLSFYDKNDIEVAYISDYKLFITNAQITGTLTLGRYELDTSNGLAFKWV